MGTAHRTIRVRLARWLPPITAVGAVAAVLVLTTPGMAMADTDDIIVVLDNLRLVIVVLAGAAVAVMLTLGGLRYLLASDPGETEKAKSALRAAAIGFGIILLAIPFVEILQGILTYE
ncbi:pilin [Glycomyces sp. TRM65418]|uniref:pilin n=1 Tax=Glycomyces sp. TRM65418 TaxID=2867006 RepID=UPI001CE6DF61|nr:pilin [Glycomyces sp. TRM65418]MCC3762566.1 pilin [Glycomyces sp. TRM65418]QZD56605.1 pilin [Glycomyces sp. TRM65418]